MQEVDLSGQVIWQLTAAQLNAGTCSGYLYGLQYHGCWHSSRFRNFAQRTFGCDCRHAAGGVRRNRYWRRTD